MRRSVFGCPVSVSARPAGRSRAGGLLPSTGHHPRFVQVFAACRRCTRCGIPVRSGGNREPGGPFTQGPRSADQARRRSVRGSGGNGSRAAVAFGKGGSGPRAWGSGPHHVAVSRTAITSLPLRPLPKAACLRGLQNPRAVVSASSLAAPPLVTTRARWRGKRQRTLNRPAARPRSHLRAAKGRKRR
jgi:hypothetical protein